MTLVGQIHRINPEATLNVVLSSSREIVSLKFVLKTCQASRLLQQIEWAYSLAPNSNGWTIPSRTHKLTDLECRCLPGGASIAPGIPRPRSSSCASPPALADSCTPQFIPRVPQGLSPRRNWDSPTPSPTSDCLPLPWTKGGETHPPAGEGVRQSQLR